MTDRNNHATLLILSTKLDTLVAQVAGLQVEVRALRDCLLRLDGRMALFESHTDTTEVRLNKAEKAINEHWSTLATLREQSKAHGINWNRATNILLTVISLLLAAALAKEQLAP